MERTLPIFASTATRGGRRGWSRRRVRRVRRVRPGLAATASVLAAVVAERLL